MSKVVKQEQNDSTKEGFQSFPSNNKSASILMIQPLENINKELSYRQRQNRPFKVIQNLPINKHDPKDSINQPNYSLLDHPLSVKDSAVLYNSLIVSRFNWINHMFKTYWTRREQVIRGLDLNKKDKMIRFCNPVLSCGVHTFKIKLFFLKDDEREKNYKIEMEKRREERIRRKKERQEELQRKKEEKEREEKEKEMEREKIRQEYLAKIEEEKKKKELQQQQLQENQLVSDKQHVEGKDIEVTESNQQILSQTIDKKIQPEKLAQSSLEKNKQSESILQKEKSTEYCKINDHNMDNKENDKVEKETDNKLLVEPMEKIKEKPIGKLVEETESRQGDKQPMEQFIDSSIHDISTKNNSIKELSAPKKNEKLDETETSSKATTSDKSIVLKENIVPSNNTMSITPALHPNMEPLKQKTKPKVKEKPKPDTKDIMANPESAIMIQNLNVLAKQDPHLNALMKKVASGSASTEQILEFQKYILKAKNMGDVTGYMQKLKLKQQQIQEKETSRNLSEVEKSREEIEKEKERQKERQRKKKEKLEKTAKSVSPVPNIQTLTPEEIKRKEEDLLKRAMEMKHEQEKQRMEKIRIKEEREREKLRIKQERLDKKNREKEERERLKKIAKEQKEQEREKKRLEKLAEKEKARIEREEKIKERQQFKEKEKLENKVKLENAKKQSNEVINLINKRSEDSKLKNIKKIKNHETEDEDEDDDRMGKLNNDDDGEDDDLWNDKLSPLQERYRSGAALVFEFFENPSSRFVLPKDTIYELIDNEDDADDDSNINNMKDSNRSVQVKDENYITKCRPKSPYVTLLASFLLIHNQGEIDGWQRRQAEAKAEEEEKERKKLEAIKAEEEESSKNTIAENARKRRRKRSTWNTSSSKRATRLSKKAKEMELLRREEENFHEEDADLRNDEKAEDVRPIPIYSCVTAKLSKVPFRFANFILESGNSMEDRKKNMEEIMKVGNKVSVDQLWYQIDGIKDEILGETLRYNLNRLDYSECGGKKYRSIFYKKFGKGGKA